jgi:hypothetical protein
LLAFGNAFDSKAITGTVIEKNDPGGWKTIFKQTLSMKWVRLPQPPSFYKNAQFFLLGIFNNKYVSRK